MDHLRLHLCRHYHHPMSNSVVHLMIICISLVTIAHLSTPCRGYGSLHRHRSEAILRAAYSSSSRSSSSSSSIFLSDKPLWLNQTLDHFAPQESPTFPQRYFEFLNYFNAPLGPIFLVICGENTCGGIFNDYIGVLAKRFGAAIVTLEHRYYGYSYPFSEYKIENLQYLNTEQALFDLATFRAYYQKQINEKYNRSQSLENAWITFGGSYSGALSAWFRLKFPHLTRGSLASSAVVHAIRDYYAYDQQVANSIGLDCSLALQAFRNLINNSMKKNSTFVKSLFNAEMIEEDVDFLSFLADSTALAVQFGFYKDLCQPLVRSFQMGDDTNILNTYQGYVENTIYGDFGISAMEYNRDYLKNLTSPGPKSGTRLWTYQICTELGFFQTAPLNNSIRFLQLDDKYYSNLCKYIFGQELNPKVSETNLYYGGTKIVGSRIFFTNGSQDPWRHASLEFSSPYVPSFMIKCKNCAHMVDINGCPQYPFNPQGDASLCEPQDDIDLARKLMIEYIEHWIAE